MASVDKPLAGPAPERKIYPLKIVSDLLCQRVRQGPIASSAPWAVPGSPGSPCSGEAIHLRQMYGVQQSLTSEDSLESFTKDCCTMVAEADVWQVEQ